MAKRTTKKKKSESRRTYFSVSAFLVIVLLFIAVFQLGIIGIYVDGFFSYIFGSARYITYLIMFTTSIYIASENKFPATKRFLGYILFLLGSLFLMHSVLYFSNRPLVNDYYNLNEVIEALNTDGIFHFFGGGAIGQLLFSASSTGISVIGTILLALLFYYFSFMIIFNRNISEGIANDFRRIGTTLKTIGTSFILLIQKITQWIQSKLQQRKEHKAQQKEEQSAHKLIEQEESEQKENQPISSDKTDTKSRHNESKSDGVSNQSKDLNEGPIIEDNLDDDHEIDDTNELSGTNDLDLLESENTSHQNIEYEYDEEPTIAASTQSASSVIETFTDEEFKQLKHYQLPDIKILKDVEKTEKVSNKEVLQQGKILEETLQNFGVNAKVSKIRIGPAVTQFEIQPDIGVKVSKIINLQNDIALNLAAKDIRIEAPIPGKSAVGIEVPNSVISMVTLREVLKKNNTDNPLEVALGKDISGTPINAELNKMPHLLVAGSTGSGKSVCINGIIISLLMNAKPHEVKLMMIDPKMVELNIYNGIPHLLAPVVTNPQKASDALNKIVSEMERRYDLFSHTNTRNIEAYNQYLVREAKTEKVQKLPYIVVIIDELADLMMVASKDVEASITRIAQMARAAGIHLIIATQRPSVDVITGIIKANIPSRIAFSVSSQTDSRTIIDSQGAEKLLGRGDMLFLPSGKSKPIRVQGAFLSDDEVSDVVSFITNQMKANYETFMAKPAQQKEDVESEDELYPDAKCFVIEEQRASASLLQRQFKIGYNRAARLVDDLEANGVIGPSNGSKPRSVLIENQE